MSREQKVLKVNRKSYRFLMSLWTFLSLRTIKVTEIMHSFWVVDLFWKFTCYRAWKIKIIIRTLIVWHCKSRIYIEILIIIQHDSLLKYYFIEFISYFWSIFGDFQLFIALPQFNFHRVFSTWTCSLVHCSTREIILKEFAIKTFRPSKTLTNS